jgi:hypothetical protein
LAKYNGISIKKGRPNLKKLNIKFAMIGDELSTPLISQDLDEEELGEETPEEGELSEEEEEWEEESE